MNIEELISNYLDGELSSDAEAELHYRLAVSPEDRKTFREMIALRNIARDQRVLHTPDAGLRSALFDRLRREEGMKPAPALLPVPTVVPDYAPSRPAVPPSEGKAEERRRRRRIIPFLIPLLLLVISSGVYWGLSDGGPGAGEGTIVSNDLDGLESPHGDMAQEDAGSMRVAPGDRMRKEATAGKEHAAAATTANAPVAARLDTFKGPSAAPEIGKGGSALTRNGMIAEERIETSQSLAYSTPPADIPRETKDMAGNVVSTTSRRDAARKSQVGSLRSQSAAPTVVADESVSITSAAGADGSIYDVDVVDGDAIDLGSTQGGESIRFNSTISNANVAGSLGGGVSLRGSSSSDVLNSGRESEKKVEIGPSWTNSLEPSVDLSMNMSRSKSTPSLLGDPPNAPAGSFSNIAPSGADTTLSPSVIINGIHKVDGLEIGGIGEGIAFEENGPSGNPRGRSYQSSDEKKSLSAASVEIANEPERANDRAMITAADGTKTNLDTTAAVPVLQKPLIPEVAIVTRDEESASYEYDDAMLSSPLSPTSGPRGGYLFARPRQNFVVDMRHGGIVPEQSLGIGYRTGNHSIEALGGRSGYRLETQRASSLVRGSGASFESISTTTHSSEIEYEYWGGLGYGYERRFNDWTLGGEISLGLGSKFARASAGLPISYEAARNVRIEVVPMLQYARSIDDAPTSVSEGPQSPGAEMTKEESSRQEEEIRAGIGAGVIIIIR